MSLATFQNLMTHTVDLKKMQRDYTGSLTVDTTYNDETCFVEYGRKRIVNDQGEEVLATAIIYFPDDGNFDPTYSLWTITHNSRDMQVQSIDSIDDPRTGLTHHYEIGVI